MSTRDIQGTKQKGFDLFEHTDYDRLLKLVTSGNTQPEREIINEIQRIKCPHLNALLNERIKSELT